MTPLRPRQIPFSFFQKLNNFPDLHYLVLPSLYPALHFFVRNCSAFI